MNEYLKLLEKCKKEMDPEDIRQALEDLKKLQITAAERNLQESGWIAEAYAKKDGREAEVRYIRTDVPGDGAETGIPGWLSMYPLVEGTLRLIGVDLPHQEQEALYGDLLKDVGPIWRIAFDRERISEQGKEAGAILPVILYEQLSGDPLKKGQRFRLGEERFRVLNSQTALRETPLNGCFTVRHNYETGFATMDDGEKSTFRYCMEGYFTHLMRYGKRTK